MNLNHRVADNQLKSPLDVVFHKIEYPLSIAIPIVILFLSFWSLREYPGQAWDIGTFSTAIVPGISTILSDMFRGDQNNIASWFVIVGVALGPLFFYLFTFILTRRHLTAVITALLTLAPLIPFSSYSDGRTLLALTSSDGAHVVAFSFIPLTSLAFLYFIRTENFKYLLLFIVLIAIPIMLSFFSLFILFIFLLFTTCSEILVGQGRLKVKRALKALGVLFLLAVLTYNVSLFGIFVSGESHLTVTELVNLFPLTFFIVPVLGTFAFLIFDRRPVLQPLFLALVYLIVFGLLHLVRISFVESAIFQQSRYKAEVAFSLALSVGIIFTWLFDMIRSGAFTKKIAPLHIHRNLIAFACAGIFILIYITGVLFVPKSPY